MTTPTRRRRKKMKPRTKSILVSFTMGILVGIVVTLSLKPEPVSYIQAPAQTTAVVNKAFSVQTSTQEDGPGADCRKSGNHICGPSNPQHVKPGLYKNGRLVVTWYELKTWGVWQYGPPANAK